MRHFVVGLVLLASSLAWLYFHRSLERAHEDSGLQPSAPIAKRPLVVSTGNRKLLPVTKVALAPQAPDADPQGNIVAFQVVDGLAIAYGDVIIGQPEDPTIQQGFADSPPPVLWDRPEIPYAISDDLPNPQRVHTALDYFSAHTPLTFVPYEGQPDALVFEPGVENCYSLLGKHGGAQPIKLASDCAWPQIAHEILHALGFVHEQSRFDRDSYVEILWDNIEPKFRSQFARVPDSYMEASRLGPFDYESIMLYPPDMFAAEPGHPTMRSRGQHPLTPSTQGLSAGDLARIHLMYRPYDK